MALQQGNPPAYLAGLTVTCARPFSDVSRNRPKPTDDDDHSTMQQTARLSCHTEDPVEV